MSMHTFGCLCYPWMRPYSANKLAPRSTRCAFMGYSKIHKGYICLDMSTSKFIISRHIIFYDQEFPFTTSTHEAPSVKDPSPATIFLPSFPSTTTFSQPNLNLPNPPTSPPLSTTTPTHSTSTTPTQLPTRSTTPHSSNQNQQSSSSGLPLVVDLSSYNSQPSAKTKTHPMITRS